MSRLAALALLLSLTACSGVSTPSVEPPAVPVSSGVRLPAADLAPDTILFGSCAESAKQQPIWDAIVREQGELFLMLGDNIYADTRKAEVFDRKYAELAAQPGFRKAAAAMPMLGVWDDHDYGEDDVGREYPLKDVSRRKLLDFFAEPADSPRRTQDGGVYTARILGPEGRRVQIVLLDLRWNRTPLKKVDVLGRIEREAKNMGPYLPDEGAAAQLIGESQWQWLEAQLEQPAELRLIGHSVQALAEFTGWEAWANFPRERARLLALIDRLDVRNAVFLSGDTHWAELMHDTTPGGREIWEMTSSGLTEEWSRVSPNVHRVGEPYPHANYGRIRIDWDASPLAVELSVHDVDGKMVISRRIEMRSPDGGPKGP